MVITEFYAREWGGGGGEIKKAKATTNFFDLRFFAITCFEDFWRVWLNFYAGSNTSTNLGGNAEKLHDSLV